MRDIYTFFYEVETGTAYAFGTKSSETRLLSLSFFCTFLLNVIEGVE